MFGLKWESYPNKVDLPGCMCVYGRHHPGSIVPCDGAWYPILSWYGRVGMSDDEWRKLGADI